MVVLVKNLIWMKAIRAKKIRPNVRILVINLANLRFGGVALVGFVFFTWELISMVFFLRTGCHRFGLGKRGDNNGLNSSINPPTLE